GLSSSHLYSLNLAWKANSAEKPHSRIKHKGTARVAKRKRMYLVCVQNSMPGRRFPGLTRGAVGLVNASQKRRTGESAHPTSTDWLTNIYLSERSNLPGLFTPSSLQAYSFDIHRDGALTIGPFK